MAIPALGSLADKHDVFGFERKIKPSPERARLISWSRINGVVYGKPPLPGLDVRAGHGTAVGRGLQLLY